MVKTQTCLGYKDFVYAFTSLENTKKQQILRAKKRLDYQGPLASNQIFFIITPKWALTENLFTLYCACFISTQLSMDAYQVLSDNDE